MTAPQWQENIDALNTSHGAQADAAVTNPASSASEIALLKGIISQLQSGGTSGTQYTDGAAAPTHPIGTEIAFNNAGTMTAVSAAAPLPITGSISATNPSVGTDGSAIPTSSTLLGASDGTNLQQLLVESASNRNLRTAIYNAANELGIDAGGRLTAILQAVAGTALAADQTNSELRVSNYVKTTTAGDTALTLGSATIANSLPVGIASDQIVPVKRNSVAAYTLASTTTSGSTQNSGDITVGPYTEISIDINTTAQAGTSPTLQIFWERKGADGIYYVLWQSAVLTAAANTLSTSIGAGMAYNQSLGLTGRLRWVVGGSATPTYTFSANIYGK